LKISKMAKMGAAGLVAFCAASFVADKMGLGTSLAQIAGFIGGFTGSLAASPRAKKPASDEEQRRKPPGG
jgi:hypothetical protein